MRIGATWLLVLISAIWGSTRTFVAAAMGVAAIAGNARALRPTRVRQKID